MSSIKRGRTPDNVRSVQAMPGIRRRQVNRNRRTLGKRAVVHGSRPLDHECCINITGAGPQSTRRRAAEQETP
jgi:molybdate-binding protein